MRVDRRGLARWQHADGIAGLDRAGRDLARKAAEIEVGPVDPLHRHAERLVLRCGDVELDGFEVRDQWLAHVPRHVGRVAGDIVALEARNRHCGEVGDADRARERGVIGDNRVILRLIIVDQVHLVDREHDVADADQVREIAVAPRLDEHALARVDQDDRQVGGRGAGDHVARVLFMAGRVGDDELALFGGEKPVGDVDGDALFALGRQPVDEQCKVDVLALRAHLFGIGLEAGELVFEDHLRIVEQPADQRRFAVIDRAAGDEAQQRLVLVRFEIGVDVRGDQIVGLVDHGRVVDDIWHQKYPSAFFFSMLAAWSWSMARPCRSEVVVSSISWMTCGSVVASLSTAPVSG
jgi:hypothetical protein